GHLHSQRTFAKGFWAGGYPRRVYTRKRSAALQVSRLVLNGSLTIHTTQRKRDLDLQFRLHAAGSTLHGVPSSEVCWSWRRPAMSRSGGRAAPKYATPA